MATEVRHCEICDHEFEVEVAPGDTPVPLDGCPDQTDDCGLANAGDRIKVRRQID
jgi:hypothetical protein